MLATFLPVAETRGCRPAATIADTFRFAQPESSMSLLHAHLLARTGSAYRRLRESLHGLSADQATAGAQTNWRRYRFGVGLDGSISGIVHHVATWKLAAAAGLRCGSFPNAEHVLPRDISWDDLLAALNAGQQRLVYELELLSEEGLDVLVTWEGQAMSIHALFAHLIEHDQYHTGQINLLRQQLGHILE